MANDPEAPAPRVGLMRVREHCAFAWDEPAGGGVRSVEILASHCDGCIEELRGGDLRLVFVDGERPPRVG